jgi:hypothetical protein
MSTNLFVVSRQDWQRHGRNWMRVAISGGAPLLLLAVAIVAVDMRLTLVAVLAAFFGMALFSAARRVRASADRRTAVEVSGDRVCVDGSPPKTAVGAVRRKGYVRILFASGWVYRIWIDNRRDPSAFIDLPLPPPDDERCCGALRDAGVPVARQSVLTRVAGVLAALAVTFGAFLAIKVTLALSAVVLASLAVGWLIVVLVSLLTIA